MIMRELEWSIDGKLCPFEDVPKSARNARLTQRKTPEAPSRNQHTKTILQTFKAQVPGWTRYELSNTPRPKPPRSISIFAVIARSSAVAFYTLGASLPAAATTSAATVSAAVPAGSSQSVPPAAPAASDFWTSPAATATAATTYRHDERYEWHEYGGRNACADTRGSPG